jgi:hypothetical protein
MPVHNRRGPQLRSNHALSLLDAGFIGSSVRLLEECGLLNSEKQKQSPCPSKPKTRKIFF